MMSLSSHIRIARIALGASLLALLSHAGQCAQISGSIRFSDEDFSLEVRTTGTSLSLSSRGCNNFDLAVGTQGRKSQVLLRDANGATIGTIGSGKFVEARACGAERYSTEVIFGAPATTTWNPEADAVRGSKRIKYTASLSPTQIRFDPALALTIFDRSTRARPIKVSGVASIAVQEAASILYSSDAIHFLTTGGTIHRNGGFTGADEFSLSSGSQRFVLPAVGRGSEITFDAPADRPTSLSLYYPIDGPHVLAFFGDDKQREPTSVSSLRVDGKGLLTPEIKILSAGPIVVKRELLHFLSPQEQLATGSLEIHLGSAGVEVRDVRVETSDANILELGQTASGPYEPVLSYATLPGSVPLELTLRARVPKTWEPGEHAVAVTVTGEGDLRREIPVTIQVEDPYRTARTALLATLGAILIALVLWILIKKRRIQSEQADARVVFFQRHDAEYARVRERIELLLASETQWPEVEELLDQFSAKELQTVLTPQQWNAITELSKQQKSRDVLETLDRALAKFGG